MRRYLRQQLPPMIRHGQDKVEIRVIRGDRQEIDRLARHAAHRRHVEFLLALQQRVSSAADRPSQSGPREGLVQVVGDPEDHGIGALPRKLRQRDDRLVDLRHLVVRLLRPVIVADDGLGPEGGHDVDEVELEVAGDRPAARAACRWSCRPARLLVVLAGLDVFGQVAGVAAQADDLSHVVLLDLGGRPERVGLGRRRLHLRRVVVAHGLVSVEGLGAELAQRHHPPRREDLQIAPRLRLDLAIPARVRVAVVDHVWPQIRRAGPSGCLLWREASADRYEDPLGDRPPGRRGRSARCRTGARWRSTAARRRGCCSICRASTLPVWMCGSRRMPMSMLPP